MGCTQSSQPKKNVIKKGRSKRLMTTFIPNPQNFSVKSPNGRISLVARAFSISQPRLRSDSVKSVSHRINGGSFRVPPEVNITHEAITINPGEPEEDYDDNVLFADYDGRTFQISPENYSNYGKPAASKKFFDHSEYSDRRSYTTGSNAYQEYDFGNRVQMILSSSKHHKQTRSPNPD